MDIECRFSGNVLSRSYDAEYPRGQTPIGKPIDQLIDELFRAPPFLPIELKIKGLISPIEPGDLSQPVRRRQTSEALLDFLKPGRMQGTYFCGIHKQVII
ncbi:MAG: hypothetical protein PHE55_20115 [Methylococcaceae bacterium]|nr:hypothetical protein [Methylococcaceae bacterium]